MHTRIRTTALRISHAIFSKSGKKEKKGRKIKGRAWIKEVEK
jgi:hypothetical protein